MDHTNLQYIGACNEGISSFLSLLFNCQEAIFIIPLEMLITLSAEVVGNLCSKSRKRHFWRPKIQKFSGGACPRNPLVKSASGTRLSIGHAMYIRKPLHAKRLATPLYGGRIGELVWRIYEISSIGKGIKTEKWFASEKRYCDEIPSHYRPWRDRVS